MIYYYCVRVFEDGTEDALGRSNDPDIARQLAQRIAFESSRGGQAIIVRQGEDGEEIYRVPTAASMKAN